MLARRERRHRGRKMSGGWRQIEDDLDIVTGEERLGRFGIDAPRPCPLGRARGIARRDRDDAGIPHPREVPEIDVGDVTDAEDANWISRLDPRPGRRVEERGGGRVKPEGDGAALGRTRGVDCNPDRDRLTCDGGPDHPLGSQRLVDIDNRREPAIGCVGAADRQAFGTNAEDDRTALLDGRLTSSDSGAAGSPAPPLRRQARRRGSEPCRRRSSCRASRQSSRRSGSPDARRSSRCRRSAARHRGSSPRCDRRESSPRPGRGSHRQWCCRGACEDA